MFFGMDLSLEPPKRRSADSSPEFEFWMVGNPSYPQPELLTADELFVDGVLRPLHLLSVVHSEADPEPELAEPPPDPSPPLPPPLEPSPASITSSISSSPSSGSKRWRDIFKVGEKKGNEKERPRRESKGSGGSAAELNINIWPFSRSRSAGNGAVTAGRSRAFSMAGRKASSAPCSRSNSRGESSKPSAAGAGTTRRWAASPGRAGLSGGVHLGRTSPVWQIRRGEKRTEPAACRGLERANQRDKVTGCKKATGFGGSVRVLNLNVNTCIGYRNQVSCRGNGKDGVTGGGRTATEGSGGNGSLFSLRSFFSKKVY
ncbi:translation initiation factor IF-2-like [Phoenix dactylifera]|uniref:Translation initiation factor IF-2-like n=1 Tax=Phoenix dactylifera TaxID=42345 RepID=A0A8B7MWQ7_PHODC|nr:translation initiation factor IF-2-like [Phoenix dactylifera]